MLFYCIIYINIYKIKKKKKKKKKKAGEEVENKETSSNHGVVINEEVPSDKVNVRLLRPNGTRTDVLLESSDTILNLKQQILDTWPKGKWQKKYKHYNRINRN